MLIPAVLAACAGSGVVAASAAAVDDPCTTSVVQDYAAPLAAMPPLPSLAVGRTTLPFGPRGLTLIYRPGQQVTLPGSEQGVGFTLAAAAARKRAARPGWLVITRMVKVSEAGRTERLIETRHARINQLTPHSPTRLGLSGPASSGEPGFYRFEIVFRNRAGNLIARFGGYKRVLVGNLDVRFSLEKTAVHSEETLEPRLENIGAAFLTFGLGTQIEVLQGANWTLAPFGNAPPVPANGYGFIGPGEAASCWRQTIPAGASPGAYRASLHFSYQVRTGREPMGSAETRYAEFEIVP
jgi:hypothetical protein